MSSYPPRLALKPVGGPVSADVRLPGSKSITNRALLLAGLAKGESTLRGALHSEDTEVMTEALRALGVEIEGAENLRVRGLGGKFAAPSRSVLFIGNSGTTVRFLAAAACLMPEGTEITLDGVPRMRERPIGDLLSALSALGARTELTGGTVGPPVKIHGGGLPGGKCSLKGDISSQFLTGVLMAAPCAEKDVDITIVGELISKPYIEITRAVMQAFGADFENENYRRLRVRAGAGYRGTDYEIEADASNASYFMAAAALTGGRVKLTNLGMSSIQGDRRFTEVLEKMGCQVAGGSTLEIRGPAKLKAVDVDMEAIPDTAQTLAVLAAFADGPSRVTGLASLRVKETDRVTAITRELTKLGARVEEGPESWLIHPLREGAPREAVIDTYSDHRMAMAFAVAGLRRPGVVIDNPACVAKTFPDFWRRWSEAFPVAPTSANR